MKQSPFYSWGQTLSATAPKKSQDFHSVQEWLVKPVPPSVCRWHKGSPHCPPLSSSAKLRTAVWLQHNLGGCRSGCRYRSQNRRLEWRWRGLNSEVTPRESWGLHLVGKDNTEMQDTKARNVSYLREKSKQEELDKRKQWEYMGRKHFTARF